MSRAAWWPRRRSLALDAALALLVLLAGGVSVLVTAPAPARPALLTGTVLVVGALAAAGVLLRRRWPLPLLAVAVLDGALQGQPAVALPLAAYAVTRYGPRTRTRWVVLGVGAVVALLPWQFDSGSAPVDNALQVVLLVVLPAVLGGWVRTRADLLVALRDRAERAESEQRALAREAVLAERARITREMHDVVGHRVSLMVLQAGAVEMAAEDPARVRQLAGQLQNAGRRSLQELRQLIGLLQAAEPGGDAPLAPQPTLADLDELVEDARRAGLEVALTRLGAPREVDPTVGRTAYRVVQEALTNAGKHAPGASVEVTLELRPAELAVAVVNRRPTRPPAALPGGGLGLIGLRERVRTVDGEFGAEPRLDGGFRVEAVMPG